MLILVLVVTAIIAHCNYFVYATTPEIESSDFPTINDPSLKVQVVHKGLEFPTSMAFLGPDDILVLEKDKGTVQRIVNGVKLEEPLLDVNVANEYERGMLGIAITQSDQSDDSQGRSEDAASSVFVYFTESGGGKDGDDRDYGKEPLGNRLYRYEFENDKLVKPKLLLDLPAIPNRHNGGPVVIGPDENVYVTIGDVNHTTKAQNNKDGPDPDGTGGVLRVSQEGGTIEDDSILGDDDPLNIYYAYGIRNSFGMDFDPVTDNLWNTDNGYYYGDEINLVEPGFNGGWSIVTGMSSHLEHFDVDNDLVNFGGKGKYSDPKFEWDTPDVAPTALKFLNSDKLGEQYENDMFVGDFLNGNLYAFDLDNDNERTELVLEGPLDDRVANNKTESRDIIFGEHFGGATPLNIIPGDKFGGITDIEVGPDGYLYILTFRETEGTIYKIVPA